MDVSKDSFLDLGEQGIGRRRPVEAFDLQVGFRMVEPNLSASVGAARARAMDGSADDLAGLVKGIAEPSIAASSAALLDSLPI